MKIIYAILILFASITISCIVDYCIGESKKANFKQEKGSIVVLIKSAKSNRSVTPYVVYLRDSVGALKDYRITKYEKSLINIGDTIK